MVNPHSRIARLALNGLAVAMLSCFAVAPTHAQSAPVSESAPAWSAPIDDVTGLPVHYSTGTPANAVPVAAKVAPKIAVAASAPIAPKPPIPADAIAPTVVPPRAHVPAVTRQVVAYTAPHPIETTAPHVMPVSHPVYSPAQTMRYPVSMAPQLINQQWTGTTGMTLEAMLTRWCADAHVRLVWKPDFQYTLAAPLAFQGSFKQAIAELFALYHGASRPMNADFYPKQQVLVISGRSE